MQHNYKQAAYRGTNMDSTYALLGKYMETNRAVFSIYVLFSISLVVLFLLFLCFYYYL